MSTRPVAVVRRALRAVQPLLSRREDGVLFLAYHLVGAGTDSPVDVPLSSFRQQMRDLRRSARPVSLHQALSELAGGGESEGPAVAVTFDDAYQNFFHRALPVLAEERIPVTLFVPSGFIDGEIEAPIRRARGLLAASWEELAEAADGDLVTIGSHGLAHRNLVLTDEETARREIEESQRVLERRLGVSITSFCYPEGFSTAHARRLVRATYRCGFGSGGTRARAGRHDLSALPRLPIRRDMAASLETVIRSSVWLEEMLASRVRRLRLEIRRLGERGEP